MWNLCAPTMCPQKAGQPYFPGGCRVPALRCFSKRRNFEKVSVNVVPDISGLRLNFILEPGLTIWVRLIFKKSQKSVSLYPPAASCEYAGRRSLRPGARFQWRKQPWCNFFITTGIFVRKFTLSRTSRRFESVSEYYLHRANGPASPHWNGRTGKVRPTMSKHGCCINYALWRQADRALCSNLAKTYTPERMKA